MENRRSYNPHNQRLARNTLLKISDLYSHVFDITEYAYFYDEKVYLGTKNEPMNNGAKPIHLEQDELIEHLLSDWNADQMYILCNIETPAILSIGKFIQRIIDGAEIAPVLREIRRCLDIEN